MYKITHYSNFAPHRSGLYEAVKDLIKYERKLGIDSQLAVTEVENPSESMVDDWLKPISWEESKNSDLFILHRGIPLELEKIKKPTIAVIHGTADYLILEEVFSGAEKTGFNTHINIINNCLASVAVNEHDYEIYKLYDKENKLVMIHDNIDVERYTIEGYKFPFTGSPNILWCDSLRINKHPAHIIWAFSKILKELPNAKLNIVGLELSSILSWRNLILRSPDQHLAKNLESVQLMTIDLLPYMRGADILFNSNISGIPSRVELESLACGCSVISYNGEFSKYHPKPFDIDSIAEETIKCWNDIKDNKNIRQENRQWVINNASTEKLLIEKYLPLYNKILEKK